MLYWNVYFTVHVLGRTEHIRHDIEVLKSKHQFCLSETTKSVFDQPEGLAGLPFRLQGTHGTLTIHM